MTERQQAVFDYLLKHGWTSQRDLAHDFNSTIRGVGHTLSALLWMDPPRVISHPGDGGGAADREWAVRFTEDQVRTWADAR